MSAVVATHVPQRTLAGELRAARAVCRRELLRFTGSRTQVLMALVQPLLFLFVLAGGMNSLAAGALGGIDLTTFVFPGVLAMAVLFPAIFSAASLVWDRELGFLAELLVAPVSRTAILAGKCAGGAIIATGHGVVVLALAGLAGVPYDPVLLLGLLALMLLLAFTLTAFGVVVAVNIRRAQTFTSVMQLAVMPLFFASGAFYPVSGLPGWLEVVNRLDPLTYAVDPMRRLVFAHLDVTAATRERLAPGVDLFGAHVPALAGAGVILLVGVALLAAAVARLSRTE